MEKLIINSKLSDEEKILKIIEFVKSHEREGGLTDEQIAHKYVHGDCACLASLINWFIPNAKIRWIGEEEHAHAFVTIVDPRYKGQKGPFYDHENLMLFDINGKKTYEEMRQFIADEFDISEHEVTAMSVGGASIDNETTATLTSKIVISDEVTDDYERDIKNKKSKKVYSADQIKEILDGDARFLAIAYMKLGHPIAETRGKTDQELRQMIFAEVRPEDEVVLSILHGDIMQLRQFLSNMGVQKGKLLGNRSKLEQMARSIIGEDVVSFAIQNMAKKYHQPDDES